MTVIVRTDKSTVFAPSGPASTPGAKGDPGSPGEGYATRALMAARASPALLDDVHLNEKGREGKFVVDTASLWTAAIAADTAQGLFVVSTADATKVYRRVFNGDTFASWFGFKADDNGGASTDNLAVLTAAIAALKALVNVGGHVQYYGSGGSPGLCIVGAGYVSGLLTITHGLRLFGLGTGEPGGSPSQLRWPANTGGILFGLGSAGHTLEKMTLVGGFDPTSAGSAGDEGEYHAVEWYRSGAKRDLQFYNWQGDHLHDYNDAGSSGGARNTNQDEISRVVGFGGRNVYNCQGGDVNAKEIRGVTGLGNRQATIYEHGFLGNSYYGITTESNGFGAWVNIGTTSARPAAYVLFNGSVWCCVGGQETWCRTHSPPSSGDSNQGWFKHLGWGMSYAAGSLLVAYGIPDWVNNGYYRPGGGIIHQGDSNRSSFHGVYSEDNQTNQFDINCAGIFGFIGTYAYRVLFSSGLFFSDVGVGAPAFTAGAGGFRLNSNLLVTGTFSASGANSSFGPSGGGVSDGQVFLYSTNFYNSIISYLQPSNTFNGSIQLGGGAAVLQTVAGGSVRLALASGEDVRFDGAAFHPGTNDNVANLGSAGNRWAVVYAGTGTINTSDARHKTAIAAPSDKLLDAWGEVEWATFKYKDAVEAKGKNKARTHVGLVAQQVKSVFEKHGLDAFSYGLMCHDTWEDIFDQVMEEVEEEETYEVEDGRVKVGKDRAGRQKYRAKYRTETRIIKKMVARYDEEGKPVMKLVRAAGEAFGLRYNECQALENAWMRRELDKLRKAKVS